MYANLLDSYNKITQANTVNVKSVCEVGAKLKLAGLQTESDVCFNIAVRCIKSFANESRIDEALYTEGMIYSAFVKSTETEEHYFRCYEKWSEKLQALGREKARAFAAPRDPRKICFIAPNGVLLGHTEVMLKVIESWRAIGIKVDVFFYALNYTPAFLALLADRHIHPLQTQLYAGEKEVGTAESFLRLRDQLEERRIQTVVWVSVPTLASYALALRLAPRQVFWSLKFHPIFLPEVDVHLCGGHEIETLRLYHGRLWKASPFPLTVALALNNQDDIERIRERFPEGALLLGTLAREEKIESQAFLSALCAILKRNPNVHYLWAGKTQSPKVVDEFDKSGVASQCHFIGWVNTNLFAEVLDIFLETFPLGCGVTGFQAMGHGTPLLSIQSIDTLYGYQLLGKISLQQDGSAPTRPDMEALDILTAVDSEHYIELAQRLIDDREFRLEIGRREQAYYRKEQDSLPRHAKRLWSEMSGISDN